MTKDFWTVFLELNELHQGIMKSCDMSSLTE